MMTRWLFSRAVVDRVSLVHELLLLTVGWSNLANRAVRLDRSSSSIERTSVESSTTKHGWTYQKAEFVDKHSSSQYNRIKCFLLLVPQTFYLSATTKQRGFIHDYNVSFQHSSILPSKLPINCRPWRPRLVMVLWLNSQQNCLLQCKQSHEANASKCVRPFIGASNLRPYIYNNITVCQLSSFT